jgi:hypothetical protein
MTKRTPYTQSKKKPSAERLKRIAAIKTAIPLLLTLGLLALVYVFVLIPEEPSNVLKRAVINSTDSTKYKSLRYDGTFGDTNRGLEGEYAGQKASSGDAEFRVRLTKDKQYTSIETTSIGSDTYVRLSGVENAKSIIGGITGVKVPDDTAIGAMSEIQNKWIRLDSQGMTALSQLIPCTDKFPGISQTASRGITDENYPLVYIAGPILPKDDTEDEIYEAKLSTNQRTQGSFEQELTTMIECLEANYGKDDFRLREATPTDVETAKVTVLVDPLSSTVKRLTIKQVGMYYLLNLRDYNKDIEVVAPEGSVDLGTLYSSLSDSSKAFITSQIGLPVQ